MSELLHKVDTISVNLPKLQELNFSILIDVAGNFI